MAHPSVHYDSELGVIHLLHISRLSPSLSSWAYSWYETLIAACLPSARIQTCGTALNALTSCFSCCGDRERLLHVLANR